MNENAKRANTDNVFIYNIYARGERDVSCPTDGRYLEGLKRKKNYKIFKCVYTIYAKQSQSQVVACVALLSVSMSDVGVDDAETEANRTGVIHGKMRFSVVQCSGGRWRGSQRDGRMRTYLI